MIRRGMTVVEWLCVIAIVLLLLAFLMPVMTRGSKCSNTSDCLSNLRSIGLIEVIYSDEYERFTHWKTAYTKVGNEYVTDASWARVLIGLKYETTASSEIGAQGGPPGAVTLERCGLWLCPSDYRMVLPEAERGARISYGINKTITNAAWPNEKIDGYRWLRRAQVKEPAKTALVGEIDSNPRGTGSGMLTISPYATPGDNYLSPVHPDKKATQVNVAFVDGHTESVTFSNIRTGGAPSETPEPSAAAAQPFWGYQTSTH